MRYTVLSVIFIFAFLVACAQQAEQNATSPTGNVVQDLPAETAVNAPVVPDKLPSSEDKKAIYTVENTEGDLVQLKPEAVDPDGEKVAYTFTKPFDANGRWQTRIGDEGKYDVVVGASDGKLTTTETVRVIVKRANRAPVIDCGKIVVNEAEQVDLHDRCTITDEDDSEVVVTYSGWMDSWRYTTTYDDAGVHTVTITASDKRAGKVLHTVTKNVDVTVRNVNRPPQFADKFPTTINAVENDIITIPRGLISDPDGDKFTVTYSRPFDNGDCWKTKLGDAGTYDVDVVVSDGNLSVKRTVKIKIALLNTPPVLKLIPDMTVKEGETVKLPIVATDREGDKLTITISGWMTADTKKTDYGDAGEYTSKVVVGDGEYETSQVVHVTVLKVNRPPVFVVPA